jgi:hypothetical protein
MTTRSGRQNNALHLYLTILAEELKNQGQTMQGILKRIDTIEILPTTEALKSTIWKPLQDKMFDIDSTTKLEKADVTKVHEYINAWTTKEFGIDIPFPSQELSTDDDLHI